MEEIERRCQITLREQKELEDARELAAAQLESRRIGEEEEENRQKGEKSKMTLRPRTKSSSTCKSSGEDSKEDSDNESYPPDSEDGGQDNEEYRAQYSDPGREIVDPSSNDEEMDTTEQPCGRSVTMSTQKILIRAQPLAVWTQKGDNLTRTINTVLGNNEDINMDLFLRNLLVTLTRAEEGIQNEGLRVGDQKIARQRRYDAAKRATEHTWRRQDSEEYFKKRDKKDTKRSTKKEKTQKATPTRKKTGSLNRTVDLVSPECGQSPDLKTKKRNHDNLDTDYSSDDDRVPSECDECSKTVIKNKNKKIQITKQLLKGKKEETKNLRNELRELEGQKRKQKE